MNDHTIGTLTRAETLAAWVEAGTWDHVRVLDIPVSAMGGEGPDVKAIFACQGPTFVAVKPSLTAHTRETVTFIRMETDAQANDAVNEAADGLARTVSLAMLARDLMSDAGGMFAI